MIQDFDETVEKLAEGKGFPAGDSFVPRLCETAFKFGQETVRDLQIHEWRNQFYGGLNAGYILGLIGQTREAVEFFDKSLRIHQENRDEYSQDESSVIEFIVSTLEEFELDEEIIAPYRVKLEQAREREIETPQDLHRKIVHIGADLECAEGDLNTIFSQGRREQGILYQRLGDHEQAIANFRRSMSVDSRDFRNETTIRDTLLIIDSLLALGDSEAATAEFSNLLQALGPNQIEMGEQLPQFFTDNFSKLHPYLAKLGLEESMTGIAEHAAARLEKIEPKEHRDRDEVCRLTEILAVHYVAQGDYQKASQIFEAGREQLEYKHHLSRREQAEFALRAGDPDKARELISQDDADKDRMGMDRDEKMFELANLELQLGNLSSALDRLDEYCERYKRGLISGSYDSVYETRRAQVDIMKGAIGEGYLQKVRDHLRGKQELRLDAVKFLD